MSFPDAESGWAVGDSGLVLHTANGGQSWERQDAGTKSDLIQVDFSDPDHGWALGDPPSSPDLLALHTVDLR